VDSRRQDILWEERQLKRATDETYKANRRRLETVVSAIGRLMGPRARADVKILNIGAGDARLEGMLLERGYDAHLLDPTRSIIDFVRERYGLGESKARCGWSQDIPFESDMFDVVVMTEVVEHLDADTMRATFTQVRRVLKPGGYFVGTVPDNEDLATNSYRCLHCGEVSHRVGHEQSFTTTTMREALSHDFRVVSVKSFRGMYMNWKGVAYHHWIDLPFKFARLLKPDVRSPHQIVFNIFFVAQKR